jgi:predicted transcriptional regulator
MQSAMQARVTVEKTPNRAGATPLFRLSAAQKVRWVAPARWHGKSASRVFSTVTGARSKQSLHVHATKRACMKGRSDGNSQSSTQTAEDETLQLRVEEEIKSKLAKYAEFIDSSESYVVSEALKLVFRKDDEFRVWLNEHNGNGDHSQSSGESLFETAGKA